MNKRLVQTHTNRLLKLAHIVEQTPKEKFIMKTWGEHQGSHKPSTRNFCGTVACALGHAGMDKGFRKAGLKTNWYYKGENLWYATITLDGVKAIDEFEHYKTAAPFFGLWEYEAIDIFMKLERTKAGVVAVINNYANNREELRKWNTFVPAVV